MPVHQLVFGLVGPIYPGQAAHVLSGKPADVLDLTCPCCGETLFIYYRTLGKESSDEERQEERKPQ